MKTVCSVLSALVVVLVASTVFGIPPSPELQSQHWTTQVLASNAADTLSVFDGLVANGTSYLPISEGSELVTQTSPADPSLANFTFKQRSTPEPATIALMGFGLAAIFMRRQKGRFRD